MTKVQIQSDSFENNKMMPAKFTCDSSNISPGLSFSGIPDGSKSLVLIMDDPDAPGGTWIHWTVWNIDPSVTKIPENSVPGGSVEGKTDFGKPGYGGPCPPSGTHRYFFKLYALDTVLDLDASAAANDIEKAMKGHTIDSAELIGLYKRS
jgi:Raf kinase inhibitor-like YbhB/YbcL family protein